MRLGPSGVVQSASEIIATWPHEQSAVTPGAMDSYLMRLVLAKTHKRALLGPKYDGKNSSARLVSAIPAIAARCSRSRSPGWKLLPSSRASTFPAGTEAPVASSAFAVAAADIGAAT